MCGPRPWPRSPRSAAWRCQCDGLGEVVVEVVKRGNWGTAKVQGSQITLIPRWFAFTVTESGTVLFTESHAKRPADIDTVCRYAFDVVVPEDDPDFPAGTYRFDAEVGAKVRGR
jgi:hypothetical protein